MSELHADFERVLCTFEPERVQRLVGEAIWYLQARFGVEHMSIIEGVRLRKIAEEELLRYQRESQMDISFDNMTDPVGETGWRWLSELYDLHIDAMPAAGRGEHVRLFDDPILLEYLRRRREDDQLLFND